MNYYFTGVLIVLFVLLCFIRPAHPRNEYLSDGTNTCSTGDLSLSVEQSDSESRYRHNNADNNYNSPYDCLLYTSPSPRDRQKSRMPSSA